MNTLEKCKEERTNSKRKSYSEKVKVSARTMGCPRTVSFFMPVLKTTRVTLHSFFVQLLLSKCTQESVYE